MDLLVSTTVRDRVQGNAAIPEIDTCSGNDDDAQSNPSPHQTPADGRGPYQVSTEGRSHQTPGWTKPYQLMVGSRAQTPQNDPRSSQDVPGHSEPRNRRPCGRSCQEVPVGFVLAGDFQPTYSIGCGTCGDSQGLMPTAMKKYKSKPPPRGNNKTTTSNTSPDSSLSFPPPPPAFGPGSRKLLWLCCKASTIPHPKGGIFGVDESHCSSDQCRHERCSSCF